MPVARPRPPADSGRPPPAAGGLAAHLARAGVRATLPVPGGRKAKAPPAAPAPPPTPGPDWWLRSPDLAGEVGDDLGRVGGVGERDALLLVYLAYTSRLLRRPLAVIVRGPSGSGKDAVQRLPAELMPPEAVVDATSLTPQALFYAGPDALRHKVLLCGERRHDESEAARDATAGLRQLVSLGFLSKRAVRDGQGVELRVDGPVAYSETTTKEWVFAEDLNRCLEVHTDASPEQTRAVMRAKAREYVGGGGAEARGATVARHHDFQRSLLTREVSVPFAPALAEHLPADRVEARRRFGQVLSLVEAVALLHQHRRESDAAGRLVATVADYALARRLALGPLQASLGLGADHATWTDALAALPDEFSSTDAAAPLDADSRKVVSARLRRMAELGLIRQTAAGSGNKPARWAKTGVSADELLLPSAAAVEAADRAGAEP